MLGSNPDQKAASIQQVYRQANVLFNAGPKRVLKLVSFLYRTRCKVMSQLAAVLAHQHLI
jgi:hypothetical protein